MSEQIQNEFVTTAVAAEMLGIHPSTAGQYCQAGELEAHKVGVAWAIKRASVEAMIKEREVNTAGYTLTTKAVAAKLNLKLKTIIHLCSQGDLSAVKDGTLWLIDPASVTAYQQRGTKQEPVAWQARPAWDWSANVRATWEDKVQAAIRQLRGPGQ